MHIGQRHTDMTDREKLLDADPVGLTQRELLWRLDARFDRFEARLRKVEDEQLTGRIERQTIRTMVVGSMLFWPVVAFLAVNVLHVVP